MVVPLANAREASLIDGLTVYAMESLRELLARLRGEQPLEAFVAEPEREREVVSDGLDLADVRGQLQARRAAVRPRSTWTRPGRRSS